MKEEWQFLFLGMKILKKIYFLIIEVLQRLYNSVYDCGFSRQASLGLNLDAAAYQLHNLEHVS